MATMDLAGDLYNYERLRAEHAERAEETRTAVMAKISKDHMAPLYAQLCEKFEWPVDSALLESMREKNKQELDAIQAKIEDATKNAGDTEVIEGFFLRARYEASIGDIAAASATFDLILSKPKTVTGKKIDAHMEKAKLALFTLDTAQLKESVAQAKALNETGGDWDRRNRLKIYEALYLLHTREVAEAATLLLDCVATFSSTELITYNQFIFYVLTTAVITLDRNDLRKKVIKDPHVITAVRDLPLAHRLVTGIYACDYKAFFEAIAQVSDELLANRFLGPLHIFLLREYRVLAYKQFLEAYKSVMLSSMAASFGISVPLLDAELSRFIAAGRLNAKIDKVGDIVETRRPDKKNTQYHEVIKKGDALLNHIQKLVRAIDV